MSPTSPIGFSFITPIPTKLTGLSSYADSLIEAFSKRHDNLVVKLITNADPVIFEKINKNSNVEIIRISGSKLSFKMWSIYAHFKVSVMARLRKISCLVSITPQGSFIPFVNQVIVIHDIYDLDRQYRASYHVLYSRMVRKLSIHMAKGVVCVSDTTLSDVCVFLGPTSAKFTVIKEASKYETVPPDTLIAKKGLRSRFLFVANVEKTKNVVCLLEALRLAQHRGLSIEVDWIGRDPGDIIGSWTRENGDLRNFFPRGYVTDEALSGAYEDSLALVVPSLREGFCLPVLEAHSFGTPVVCSDIPILREVAGAAGVFFKATDPEQLLAALEVLSSNVTLRAELRQKAIANARLYSWDQSAEKFEHFALKCCRVIVTP